MSLPGLWLGFFQSPVASWAPQPERPGLREWHQSITAPVKQRAVKSPTHKVLCKRHIRRSAHKLHPLRAGNVQKGKKKEELQTSETWTIEPREHVEGGKFSGIIVLLHVDVASMCSAHRLSKVIVQSLCWICVDFSVPRFLKTNRKFRFEAEKWELWKSLELKNIGLLLFSKDLSWIIQYDLSASLADTQKIHQNVQNHRDKCGMNLGKDSPNGFLQKLERKKKNYNNFPIKKTTESHHEMSSNANKNLISTAGNSLMCFVSLSLSDTHIFFILLLVKLIVPLKCLQVKQAPSQNRLVS